MSWYKSLVAFLRMKKVPLLKAKNLILIISFIISIFISLALLLNGGDILLCLIPVFILALVATLVLKGEKDDDESGLLHRFYTRLLLELDASLDMKKALEASVESLPISKLKTRMVDYVNSPSEKPLPPPLDQEKSLATKDLVNYLYQGLKKGRINAKYMARLQELIDECFPPENKSKLPSLYFLLLLALAVSFCLTLI